ncbi:MAG: hypothetical protein A3G41_08560 [Elusimicrobia bacterium RIFCSPLOWO2_12_FULL_59_9]|nr:MAG: hypothetical protein A3G41_08560 [Elusimicrobia bacterium RIFCSPLOWO2_12_FULL_59_9]
MDKLYAEVGKRIRALRKAFRLTQAQVAESAGIDPSFYGQIERGAGIPSLKTFLAIAQALDADPSDLLPPDKSRKRSDSLYPKAFEKLFTGLKPGKRDFLLGVVQDLVKEFKK